VITVAAGLRVLIATKPVDFRKGADGLAALVRETLGDDPFSGSIYVFRSKRADRVKSWAGMALGWCFCGSGLRAVRSGGRQLPTV
jgi:transposase